jgi:hypothetical protein
MKNITRLSLALIMFSLFSVSYLVISVSAQTGTPGMPPTGMAQTGTPGMPPTGMAQTGTPGMPPTGMAQTGTPGMPPTGMAQTGTPESGGISGWIKGGLKALGIGKAPAVGDISHCAQFSGPPKEACEAAAQ